MDILEIFQSFGFPAACVVVLFIQNNKFASTLGELSTTLTLMNERLKAIEDGMEETKK